MINGKFTTSEAADLAGISITTLNRWIAMGKVKAPKPSLVGAIGYRLWTADDVETLKVVKKAIYWKGGGRKKSLKK